MDSGSKPCSLITAFVKQSFTLFSLNTKAQFPQCSCVPAGYKLALAAIFPVHGIAELDEVFVAAHSLRERPLQTVRVGSAFGAAGGGIAVGGAIIGHGWLGSIVPPLTGRALSKEGMCV
jgi:hypothetical protein